jgi:hypothetical protein
MRLVRPDRGCLEVSGWVVEIAHRLLLHLETLHSICPQGVHRLLKHLVPVKRMYGM